MSFALDLLDQIFSDFVFDAWIQIKFMWYLWRKGLIDHAIRVLFGYIEFSGSHFGQTLIGWLFTFVHNTWLHVSAPGFGHVSCFGLVFRVLHDCYDVSHPVRSIVLINMNLVGFTITNLQFLSMIFTIDRLII